MTVRLELQVDQYLDEVGARLAAWGEADVLRRIWDKDHTVWSPTPVPELTDRLGWLELPERLSTIMPQLVGFGDGLVEAEITHVVVLGMGGSSLAPEVFAETLGSAPGAPQLLVLDSTHPQAVLAVEDAIDIETTVFIVASKSGTTIEPLSFMEYFWAKLEAVVDDPGSHFVATTDPGSHLEKLARERGFDKVFLAPSDVGGRYSALTEFGMVPAAAIGADLVALAASAMEAQDRSSADAIIAESVGCRLGAAMGELALAGRDKITFLVGQGLEAFPAWIEQLIAESTGKDGSGIIPVGGESLGTSDSYGNDRFFVVVEFSGADPIDIKPISGHPIARLHLDSPTDIAGAMYHFELATALAGAVLGIQPFDQPDVQLAKELARDAMAGDLDTSDIIEVDAMSPELDGLVQAWLQSANAGDYVGIQAFIQPTAQARHILDGARHSVRDATKLATTVDFGPRFLHSTGQLHKGGPNTGVFLEIIDHPTPALAVPTTDYTFADLITAQSLGDHLALRQRGRRLLLVCMGDHGEAALRRIAAAVTAAGG